jgi:hypothetical protein
MAFEEIRFGVKLARKTDGVLSEIAETVERRTKTNFHQTLCNRLARMWQEPEKRKRLLEIGLIRAGEE